MLPIARTMMTPKIANATTTTPSSIKRVCHASSPTVAARVSSNAATIASGAATAVHRSRFRSMSSLAFATADCASSGAARWMPKRSWTPSSMGIDLQDEIQLDHQLIRGTDDAEESARRIYTEVGHAEWQLGANRKTIGGKTFCGCHDFH